MKSLVSQLLKMFMMVVITIAVFWFVCPREENGYLEGIEAKMSLLKNTSVPRIMFAGGSNLAFGIDSSIIQEEARMEVINTGLHYGLGLKYSLNSIKPYIQKDDILIIIPEYEQFYDNAYNGRTALITLLEIMPQEIRTFDFDQIVTAIKNFPRYARARLDYTIEFLCGSVETPDVYYKDAFNQYGDVVSHLNKKSLDISGQRFLDSNIQFNTEVIDFMNEFNHYIQEKNAKAYFNFSCIPDTQYRRNKHIIEKLHQYLRENLDMEIVSSPSDNIFPESSFFDQIYHLNAEGRKERTNKLVDDMVQAGIIIN